MAAAEVNGSSGPVKEEEEPMDVTTTHTENYQTLIDAGLPQKVAESLDNIFQTGGWWLFWLLNVILTSCAGVLQVSTVDNENALLL